MRILEVTQPNTGLTVVVFKGMAHGVTGNQACEQIAQTLDGQAFGPCNDSAQVRANVAAASRYFASRPGTRLVVIGYSKGLEGCVAMQALKPVMTISIAGYPTTLQRDEASIGGRFINFYQQQELDNILRTKHNQGPYKPHAGRAVAVDLDHNHIVPGVMSQVINLVQGLETRNENFVSKLVTRGVEQGLARQKIQQDLKIMSNLEFEAEHGITKLQAQQDLAKAVPTPSTPPSPQWSKQQVIDYFVSRGKTAAQGAMAYERGWTGPVREGTQ